MNLYEMMRKPIFHVLFWLAVIGTMVVSLECISFVMFRLWIKKGLIPLGLMFVASACIHIYRGRKKADYIKNDILAIGVNPNRKHRYDYLRILAAVFVIITHAVQKDLANGYLPGETYFAYTVIYTLTLSCNLIYVMLSGALLLPYKEESVADFYLKRVSKIGFPMAVYFVFYLWQNNQLQVVNGEVVKNIFWRLHQGNTPESPHYWLIYTILSIYIAVPFFRYMMKSIPYKKLTALVIVIILFMTLNIFWGNGMYVGTFLSSWIGVAIIGYWVTREETQKYYTFLMILGLGNVAAAIHLINTNENFLNLICNCSPIMTLIATGLFAFVFKFKDVFDKGNWIIRIISKYSYSIILIHWWSLHWVVGGALQVRVAAWGGFGLVVSCILIVGASIFMGFLIDNLILTVIDFAFDSIVAGCKKMIRHIKDVRYANS